MHGCGGGGANLVCLCVCVGVGGERGIEVEVLLYVHRNRMLIRDESQDSHLDFHTAPELGGKG